MRYSCLGPTFAVSSACASASQSIGLGLQMIRFGLATRRSSARRGLRHQRHDARLGSPARAESGLCRPFSKGRNGMSLARRAVFILENAESALARGHAPLCELVGYAPAATPKTRAPDVVGASSAIALALPTPTWRRATSITSSPRHRDARQRHHRIRRYPGGFWRRVGSRRAVSSTKPVHGHCAGAARLELRSRFARCANRSRRRRSIFSKPTRVVLSTPCPTSRAKCRSSGDVQFLRLWRHHASDRAGARS